MFATMSISRSSLRIANRQTQPVTVITGPQPSLEIPWFLCYWHIVICLSLPIPLCPLLTTVVFKELMRLTFCPETPVFLFPLVVNPQSPFYLQRILCKGFLDSVLTQIKILISKWLSYFSFQVVDLTISLNLPKACVTFCITQQLT